MSFYQSRCVPVHMSISLRLGERQGMVCTYCNTDIPNHRQAFAFFGAHALLDDFRRQIGSFFGSSQTGHTR